MENSTSAPQLPEELIPGQYQGVHKENHLTAEFDNAEAAMERFADAKARLLDVNRWKEFATGDSAEFRLCDMAGKVLDRTAQENDIVRISLPGAKRPDGEYDWVRLVRIVEGTDPEGHRWILLTTKPIADPTVEAASTAHFFDDDSSGTFIIRLNGCKVEGNHYGRNELPNTEGGLLEKARALIVTIGAYLGMSDLQWRNLVKGLLGL